MTTFIDLDALVDETPFVIKLKGKEHTLKVATVKSYAEHMKAIQDMPLNASLSDEMALAIGIILRSFPSLTQEDIDDLTLPQLKRIADFAMEGNGASVTQTKIETTETGEGNA